MRCVFFVVEAALYVLVGGNDPMDPRMVAFGTNYWLGIPFWGALECSVLCRGVCSEREPQFMAYAVVGRGVRH